MNTNWILLAQLPPAGFVSTSWHNMSRTTRDLALVLAALAVLTLAILVWVVFFRERRRHSSSWHMRKRNHPSESRNGDGSERRRRRRRRRSEQRPRNPTLAETGGLPPVRGQPPPGSSH